MAGASITSYTLKGGGERWRLQFYYTDWRGKRVKKKKEGFRLKREALAWYHDFVEKKAPTSNMTFRTLCTLYMDSSAEKDAITTIAAKKALYERSILPFIGDIPVNEIDIHTIEHFMEAFSKRGNLKTGKPYSKNMLLRVKVSTSAVFNFAVQRGYIPTNPVKGLSLRLEARPVDPKDYWTAEEFEKFITWFDDKPDYTRYKLAYMVMFGTGCRVGECLALMVKDFDFTKEEMRITKNWQPLTGHPGGILKAPKTKTSVRTVPLPPGLSQKVEQYIKLIVGMKPDTRIFPCSRHILQVRLDEAAAAVGVKRINVHGLRHSYASLLINSGVRLETISKLMGHASVKTTADVYAHIYKNNLHKTALKIDVFQKK